MGYLYILFICISGQLTAEKGSGVMSLKDSLKTLFKEYSHGVVTARGGTAAVWVSDDHMYFFDPHGCDENGKVLELFIFNCLYIL